MAVTPATGVLANGTMSGTITILVLDADGSPLGGRTVSLSATGSGNTITPATVVTDANGQATATITSTVVGTKSLLATVGGLILDDQPTVEFVPAISASNSTVIASPNSGIPADGTTASLITVTVLDANSNPVGGQSVTLSATGSGNTLVQPLVTASDGTTTGAITTTVAETKTITATVNPGSNQVVLLSSPTVQFVPAISASLSTVVITPAGPVAANGSTLATITVTVMDIGNNPVAGQSVTLSATGSGNTLVQPAVTAGDGSTTGTIASSIAETKTITATVNPGSGQVILDTTPTVLFVDDVLDSNDVMLNWGMASSVATQEQIYDDSGSGWSARTDMPNVNGSQWWVVTRTKPTQGSIERTVAVLGLEGGVAMLDLMTFDGVSWSQDFSIPASSLSHFNKRGYDVEYEASSGHRLLVYSNGSANPQFRTESGGTWSAAADVFATAPGSVEVAWVELAVRSGSDEIAMVYLDINQALHAVIWDGDSWDEANTETTLSTIVGTSLLNKSFDAAYEQSTGDLMVAWGETANGTRYVTKAVGTTTWTAAQDIIASGPSQLVVLEPEPGSQRIAMASLGYLFGTTGLGVATWTGSAWVNAGTIDTSSRTVIMLGDLPCDLAWVGTSGVVVCMYADGNSGAIDWARWDATNGWVLQTDASVSGKGETESVILRSSATGQLMAVFSDSSLSLWAATLSGSTWTVTGGGSALIITGISSFMSRAFDIAVK